MFTPIYKFVAFFTLLILLATSLQLEGEPINRRTRESPPESYDIEEILLYNHSISTKNIKGEDIKFDWSPDGNYLIYTYYTYDLEWMTKLIVLEWPTTRIITEAIFSGQLLNQISFSPDGAELATVIYNRSSRTYHPEILDPFTGNSLVKIDYHSNQPMKIKWSPDSSTLATGIWELNQGNGSNKEKGILKIWKVSDGSCLRTIYAHESGLSDLEWAQNNTHIISCGGKDTNNDGEIDVGEIKLWEISTGFCRKTIIHNNESLNWINYTPNGTWIITTSRTLYPNYDSIHIWNANTFEYIKSINLTINRGDYYSLSPNGTVLSVMNLWDIQFINIIDSSFVKNITNDDRCLFYCSKWSPLGDVYIIASKIWKIESEYDASGGGGIVFIEKRNPKSFESNGTLFYHSNWITDTSWSKDNELISSSFDGTLRLWNLSSLHAPEQMMLNGNPIYSSAISPDGTKVVTGDAEGTIILWDLSRSIRIKDIDAHIDAVNSLDWASDGSVIVSGSTDKDVKIWDSNSLNLVKTFHTSSKQVNCVKFSPDSKKIAIGMDDGIIKIFDYLTGNLIHTFTKHTAPIRSFSWSPSGLKLASVSGNIFTWISEWSADATCQGSLVVWEVGSGICLNQTDLTMEAPIDVDWSSDGSYLVYCSNKMWNDDPGFWPPSPVWMYGFMIRIINTTTWNLTTEINEWNDWISNVEWSPNGEMIAATSISNMTIFNCDLDGDGIPDYRDEDDDNDGYPDNNDDFPRDCTQWSDSDGDGFGDNSNGINPDQYPDDPAAAIDTDGDDYPDRWNPGKSVEDSSTLPPLKLDDFPLENTQWNDTDGDDWGDNYANISWGQNRTVGMFITDAYKPDRYPLDPTRWNDTGGDDENPSDLDGDGIPDHLDPDIDNDGWNNSIEMQLGTDVWDNTSYPGDLDGDGIPDFIDSDIDDDGWNNTIEFDIGTDPYDNLSFPTDLDRDGIPDSLDTDIDGDGWNNTIELEVGKDPYDNISFPSDLDNDFIPDSIDPDIDGDGWNNTIELLVGTDPNDNKTFPSDLDNDSIPDALDIDIDGDGWNNTYENASGSDPYNRMSTPLDWDGDGLPNERDTFPNDPWPEKEEVSKEGTSTWWWIIGIVIALVVVGVIVGTVVILGKYRKSSREANEGVNRSDEELGRVKGGNEKP